MRRPAVGLDDEPLAAPEEVNLVHADDDIGLGTRQVGFVEELAQPSLRRRAGRPVAIPEAGRGSEHAHSWLPGMAANQSLELGTADAPQRVRLVDGVIELGATRLSCEVEERSGRLGDGDAVADGDLAAGQVGGSVWPDSRPAVADPVWHGDVDVLELGWVGEEGPEVGGASVAEDGAAAGGEHRGELEGAVRRSPVPEKEDAAVKRVEASGADAIGDRSGADPQRQQLRPRNHPMLPRRHPRNLPLPLHGNPSPLSFSLHDNEKRNSADDAPFAAGLASLTAWS